MASDTQEFLTWRGGIFLLIALAALSGYVSPPFALGLGIALGLTIGVPAPHRIQKASKTLLQLSVIGLGFGMNLAAVWQAGQNGFLFTVATIFGTLLLGYGLGRLLKVEPVTSLLVSSGTSICGGSAIAAVGAVVQADARSMSVSLVTVFVLNAVALFVFPPIGHLLGMDQYHFGLWAAIAIHDTSSVVGAAAKYGEEALNVATTVKLARALWIFPLAMGLALFRRTPAKKVKFPWFILFFLGASALRSLWPQFTDIFNGIKSLAHAGLTLTLFLIGAGLLRSAIRSVGFPPMAQGILLWIIVSATSLIAVETIAH